MVAPIDVREDTVLDRIGILKFIDQGCRIPALHLFGQLFADLWLLKGADELFKKVIVPESAMLFFCAGSAQSEENPWPA